IETVVILRSDGTFTRLFRYLGKGDEVFSKDGRFTWNTAGSTVTLAGDAPYQVGENHLRRLAPDGARVTGALAGRHILAQAPVAGVTERYWKLVELNGQPLPTLDRQPWLILKDADHERVWRLQHLHGLLRAGFGRLSPQLRPDSHDLHGVHLGHGGGTGFLRGA